MENHLDNEGGEHDYFTFEVAWEVANKGNSLDILLISVLDGLLDVLRLP